jgi:hypothetical protein
MVTPAWRGQQELHASPSAAPVVPLALLRDHWMSSLSLIASWCAFVASKITMVGITKMVKVGPSRRLDPIQVMAKPVHHAGLVSVIADHYYSLAL